MERDVWEERYQTGEYDPREEPSPLLRRYVDWLPDGQALEIATGTGRNALFLAENGYDVQGVDVARSALERARERAAEQGLSEATEWIQADIDEFDLPAATYDVIVVTYYYNFDRLPDLKDALAPGGVLVYEHHLRTTDDVDRGPSGDRYRMRSNDLLRACLDLTILHYEETTRGEDRRASIASLLARNSSGGRQSYPPSL